MSSAPRLKDIQTAAGLPKVSLATISRVRNNCANVSPKTASRVLRAMERLGCLVRPMTTIGLIIPDSSNPYFSQLVYTFEQELESRSGCVLAFSSERKAENELRLLHRLRDMGVQGVVYIPTTGGTQALLSIIAEGRLPVVVFDRKVAIGPAGPLDFVAVNSRHGTLCAVDYLVAHGHSGIGYLKGLEGTTTAAERFESFREAMAQNRLAIRSDWVFEGDYTPATGRACAERLLALPEADRPTAIIAANDLMAIALMQRLHQAGLRVPKDLSVVGFDDILWAEWTTPALTTIAQPVQAMVAAAVALLMKRIQETADKPTRRQAPQVLEVEPRLVPRESVGSPRTSEGVILRLNGIHTKRTAPAP